MFHLTLLLTLASAQMDHGEWPAYGHDAGGQRYVVEDQITKENVKDLQIAWTFHTKDGGNGRERVAFECTPIYVDGALYVVSGFNKVFSVDPDKGTENWSFDPKIPREYPAADEPFACRGVSTWKNSRTGTRTLFLATHDARAGQLGNGNYSGNP